MYKRVRTHWMVHTQCRLWLMFGPFKFSKFANHNLLDRRSEATLFYSRALRQDEPAAYQMTRVLIPHPLLPPMLVHTWPRRPTDHRKHCHRTNHCQYYRYSILLCAFQMLPFLSHNQSDVVMIISGQQIRSKIDSFQNANFLISQPNPMMSPLIGIVSERRFKWGSQHRV